MVGTIGVFVSMRGYSTEAIDALKLGKEINLIFFSAGDFRIVESGQVSFVSALRRKLRYAAEEGQPYLPLAPDESTPGIRKYTGSDTSVSALAKPGAGWDVVEGETAEAGLRIVFDRLSPKQSSAVRIWTAGGKLAVPSLVRRLRETGHKHTAAIVDDGIAPRLLADLQKELAHLIHG